MTGGGSQRPSRPPGAGRQRTIWPAQRCVLTPIRHFPASALNESELLGTPLNISAELASPVSSHRSSSSSLSLSVSVKNDPLFERVGKISPVVKLIILYWLKSSHKRTLVVQQSYYVFRFGSRPSDMDLVVERGLC